MSGGCMAAGLMRGILNHLVEGVDDKGRPCLDVQKTHDNILDWLDTITPLYKIIEEKEKKMEEKYNRNWLAYCKHHKTEPEDFNGAKFIRWINACEDNFRKKAGLCDGVPVGAMPQWIEYLENEGDKHVGGDSWRD